MKIGISRLALVAALAAAAVPAAFAQAAGDNPFLRGRNTAVTDRSQPEYDPEPVHAGAFNVSASLGIYGEYNDNVFAQQTNTTEDTIVRINPRFDAVSNWSVHQMTAGASVDHAEYINEGSETATDYRAYVGGRLDATRDLAFRGNVTGARITEPRWAPGSSASLVQYDRYGADVGVNWRGGRYLLDGSAGQLQDSFDAAAQAFRDVTETFLSARASYAISPDLAVFVQGRQSAFDYDLDTPDNRDSTRTTAQIGASFEFGAPFRGDVAIGNVKDEKDDPAAPNFDGLSLDGRVQWFPTQLTTLTFTGARQVFDPGLLQSRTAVGSRFGVRADHELRRNVVVFGEIGAGSTKFEDIDRSDDYVDVGLGLGYKLNKRMRIEGAYRLRNQNSTGVDRDRDIDQNILSVGLRLFP